MSDFTNEFDAIFKDVVGKLEPPTEEEKQRWNYDDIAKDLVKFASRMLQDDKLEMYGIHHVLHYINHIKRQYERETSVKCDCGVKYDFVIEAVDFTPYQNQVLDDYSRRGIPMMDFHYIIDQGRYLYRERRFCVMCGRQFVVNGKIISMRGQGVEVNR